MTVKFFEGFSALTGTNPFLLSALRSGRLLQLRVQRHSGAGAMVLRKVVASEGTVRAQALFWTEAEQETEQASQVAGKTAPSGNLNQQLSWSD